MEKELSRKDRLFERIADALPYWAWMECAELAEYADLEEAKAYIMRCSNTGYHTDEYNAGLG